MIKNNLDAADYSSSHRSPAVSLATLVLALGAVCLAACGTDGDGDDEPDTAVENLEPPELVVVPRIEAPAAAVAGGATPNNLEIPEGVFDWRVIGAAQRTDEAVASQSLKAIVGNDIAVNAARSGQTKPWPDGSMIAQYVWAPGTNPVSANTVAPGDFRALTLMVRDSDEYAADGGWAYGVWMGPTLTPPTDPAFDRACVNCHTDEVADNDYVFTRPGALPTLEAIADAPLAPTGLFMPLNFLDWRVIGVANRTDPMSPTLRVIVGNDIAVDAARAGDIEPWPEGSMLAHYVWAAGTNPDWDAMVAPGPFAALTFMVRNGVTFADDGGWAYGVWNTPELTPPAAEEPQFDRQCVGCHTDRVIAQDYVFTRPGALPEEPPRTVGGGPPVPTRP